MKKNNLILGTFLAITAILFSSFGASSASNSPSTEKIDGSTEITESGGVVTIGSQVWTSKNLDVATYRNGDVIPQVQDKEAWAELTTGAWCYYDNDTSNGKKYGKLYNWYAVNDPRGLAPNGYHISTNEEWEILIDYLGGDVEAGTKMKSTSGWQDNGDGINISGFSGLPGGQRDKFGGFGYIESDGNWWSSKEYADDAGGLGLNCFDGKVSVYMMEKRYGHSVRCLKD